MPVLVYNADVETGEYEGVSQRFAWGGGGPDLSSTLDCTGGIAVDEEWDKAQDFPVNELTVR